MGRDMVGTDEPAIIPRQLRLARESLGLSIEEVAAKLGVSVEELKIWEAGSQTPLVETLWDLADLYNRSVDYFLTPTQPLPEKINYRITQQLDVHRSPLEIRGVFIRFEELCRFGHELEILLKKPRNVLIQEVPQEQDSDVLASVERHRLKFDDKPIKDIRQILELQGVRTFELPIPGNVFSGFSLWHEIYGPCVLVNARDNAGRRHFTLAHEYAHLLKSDSPVVCDLVLEIVEEQFANRFAVSFLMPAPDVIREFERRGLSRAGLTDKALATLATRYSVSLEAIGRRLEELELVRKGMTDTLILEWEAKQKHPMRSKTPTWRRQLGEAYTSLALEAYGRELISLGKLAAYLGVDMRKALEFLEKQGEGK